MCNKLILPATFCLAFLLAQTMANVKSYYSSEPRVNFSLASATSIDIIYKLFTNDDNRDGNYTEKVLTTENICNENLNQNVPTVLIIHGYTTDDTSPWYAPLREALFKTAIYNIIYINWSVAGNKSYYESSANVKPVGKHIADFLIASIIPHQKVHLIGHSLGSQLAGYIGKSMYEKTGKRIGRITALDPARPCFENTEMKKSEVLNESDATFVDVIHSDIGFYGYSTPMGHVDYYPNGGAGPHPGCPAKEIDDNCSHARSTLYFIESVSKQIKAKEATFEELNDKYNISVKNDGKEIVFGQNVDQSARGVYIFTTNSVPPFL